MGTREGGVHVLKMDFNREEKDAGKYHGETRAVVVGGTPRSDVYSSSSAAPSRHSSPTVVELGLEPTSDRLVRAVLASPRWVRERIAEYVLLCAFPGTICYAVLFKVGHTSHALDTDGTNFAQLGCRETSLSFLSHLPAYIF